MVIGLCGVGIYMSIYGRVFAIRYGASGHDDLKNVMLGMMGQAFTGMIAITAHIVDLSIITNN